MSRPAAFDVRLLAAPLRLLSATIQYGDSLIREVGLLVFAGECDDLRELWFGLPPHDVTPILDAIDEATAAGQEQADLVVRVPAGLGEAARARLALIDAADTLARANRLLALPALPEVSVCRHWLWSQVIQQEVGAPPSTWELPEMLEPAVASARLPAGELDRVHISTVATIVADDANRIIAVNEAAGDLLGWAPGDLAGQRLIVVIPPALRERHLAGYSRMLVTGESHLLGRPVQVPALRRDGSEVEVSLTLARAKSEEGRAAFVAELRPVGL